ncbi:hypothetical protein [Janthinobacterium sp. PSPC3-1]|uniref:hypothetical protein n=1 Tax=Janthinobacterium sp. PSPC3-1 TaxID=2804653 RepID=UPI003CF70DEF
MRIFPYSVAGGRAVAGKGSAQRRILPRRRFPVINLNCDFCLPEWQSLILRHLAPLVAAGHHLPQHHAFASQQVKTILFFA